MMKVAQMKNAEGFVLVLEKNHKVVFVMGEWPPEEKTKYLSKSPQWHS